MKKTFCVLTLMILLGFSSASWANTVLLSDNFDSENGGVGALNYSGFANWTVSDGTVDLIGNGFWDFLPGNGLYVDLDGSTGNAGKMISSVVLNLQPGTYQLMFDLAGNQNNDAPEVTTVEVNMGSLFSNTYSLGKSDPFTAYTETFSVASSTSAVISFEAAGGDNIGMLLDDVSLQLVPEPATMALLGLGFIGVLRKRKV